MERKILYQLKTKDGIKSEIREADHFMPKIMLTENMRPSVAALHISSGRLDEASAPEYHARTYTMRRHSVVEFVEYEEE